MSRSRGILLVALGTIAIGIAGAVAWLRLQPSEPRLVFGAVLEPLGPLVLMSMNADGSEVQPAYPGARDRAHGWTGSSADAETLVFFSYDADDLQAPRQLEVLDAPGAAPRVVHEVPPGTGLLDMGLSPDGTTVLLSVAESHGNGPAHLIAVAVADGSSRELDIGSEGVPRDMAWSPDGTTVAYVANGLWTMAPDGSSRQPVTLPAGVVEPRTPSWSPDGTVLAFMARPNPGQHHQLFTIASTGEAAVWSSLQGAEDDLAFLPRWSPDGQSIAFESSIFDSSMQTFLATSDGEVRPIDDRPGGSWDPRWTRDGAAITYSARVGDNRYQLLRLPVDGGAAVSLGPEFPGPISATEWLR
jgi:dipeptidyl aminopeptidase/acylaminoacyl peptidase